MLEIGQSIRLPSDPKDLTRELALQCCTNSQALIQEFARLALTHTEYPPDQQSAFEKAGTNAP